MSQRKVNLGRHMESTHTSGKLIRRQPIDYETRDQIVYGRYRNEPYKSQGEWIIGGPMEKVLKKLKEMKE